MHTKSRMVDAKSIARQLVAIRRRILDGDYTTTEDLLDLYAAHHRIARANRALLDAANVRDRIFELRTREYFTTEQVLDLYGEHAELIATSRQLAAA